MKTEIRDVIAISAKDSAKLAPGHYEGAAGLIIPIEMNRHRR
jgi:hypothetical protein